MKMGPDITVKSAKKQRPPRIASCEPCRSSKLACDHRSPCSRCIRRNLSEQCVYRRNAFKRVKNAAAPNSTNLRPRLSFGGNQELQSPELSVKESLYTNAGFQGSSSLTTVLDNLREHTTGFGESEPAWRTTAEEVRSESEKSGRPAASIAISDGAQLLEFLFRPSTVDLLHQVLMKWHGKGLESHVSEFLAKPVLDTIIEDRSEYDKSKPSTADLMERARRVFEMSSQPVNVSRSMTFAQFIEQYSGPNLRWESIGVLVTLIGIAATEARAPNDVFATEKDRQALRIDMIHAASKCASFCETVDTLNDVLIMFLYQIFQLESVFYGDQSYKTWRRLNDATGALLAGGLHENAQTSSNIPFYLSELRRRIFGRMYAIDISLATFLGRPPRMSKRFCCIDLPQDINVLAYSQTIENQMLSPIDACGWNTAGHVRNTAVLRWSTITAMIREDTLQVLLSRNVANVEQSISNLRQEITDAWRNLPPFLAVVPEVLWQGHYNPGELECLHYIRLLYLHTVFLVEWAAWRHGIEHSISLLESANELLSWVNEALVQREKFSRLGFISLAWRVASCSLPAAGALALYLLQPSSGAWYRYLDGPFRRQVVENLSVLVAHIDILHTTYDGNYKLFCQAKRSLRRVVDILMQPVDASNNQVPPVTSVVDFSPLDFMVSDYNSFNGGFWMNFPQCLQPGEESAPLPAP